MINSFHICSIIFAGNTERGWNDPPMFDYSSVNAKQTYPRRTLLNKRVAYPMSNDVANAANLPQNEEQAGKYNKSHTSSFCGRNSQVRFSTPAGPVEHSLQGFLDT